MSRSTAKKLTLAGQAAAALLALGTGAIFAIGLPESAPVETKTPDAPPPEVTLPDAGPTIEISPDTTKIDFTGISERMGLFGNAPQQTVAVVPEPGPHVDDPDHGSTSAGGSIALTDRVKYLGQIQLGSRRAAMLRVDDQQRITSEGGAVRGSDADGRTFVHVEQVEADRVLVSSDGERVWIDREASKGGVPVTTVGADAAPVVQRPQALVKTVLPGGNTPRPGRVAISADVPQEAREALDRRLDAIDKLVEQGRIDADRAQVLRARAYDSLPRPSAQGRSPDE
ncbi:MAG: hypothetical protein R3B49_00795 [Phycisphaerales bacterium]